MYSVFYALDISGAPTGDIITDGGSDHGRSIVAYAIKDATLADITATSSIDDGSGDKPTSWTTSINAQAGALLIDMLATDDADDHIAAAGQIEVFVRTGDKAQSSSYKDASSGSNDMTWSGFASDYNRELAHSVIAIVPEPATMGLLALGGMATVLRRRRKG